jgi:hypothetical protein
MPNIMEEAERDFWTAFALWGISAITVFGVGLYALLEHSWWFGALYCAVGFAGIIYVAFHLKGKRLSLHPAIVVVALALTWLFLGYDIYTRP